MKLYEDLMALTDKKIYIYGAGMVAYYLARDILAETDFKIEAFMVADMKGNPSDYFNIPVREISEVDVEDKWIVIATLERLHDEIKMSLSKLGYKNILALSDEEYSFIRRKYSDLSGESYRVLRNTARLSTTLNTHISTLNKQFSSINGRVNYVFNYLRSYNEFGGNEKEKIRYLEEFKNLTADQEKYKLKVGQLIQNLDEESVETVFQILHRLNVMCKGEQTFFKKTEKEAMRRLMHEFYPRIYNVAEDVWYYNGFFLPENHFDPSVFWYKCGITELKSLKYIKEKDIIDAGGYIGDSAIVLSEYTNGKVYSFEAIKELYCQIDKTAKMNNLNNIVSVNMGLSDKCGEEIFYVSAKDVCNGMKADGVYTFEDDEKRRIYCTTIDEYVGGHDLKIGLIKADVEGAEQNLLKGAVKTIRMQKPALLISIYHSLDDFFNIKTWIESLDLGYNIRILRPVLNGWFINETLLLAE